MTALQTLEAMEAELQQDVYREVETIKYLARTYDPADLDDGDGPYIDVRLQVLPDGEWTLHHGDASYDQDHRGYWGAGTVSPDDDDVALIETARDLVDQVLDVAAQ